MGLYKYVTAERIDILEYELIRYTPPSALNDPYEITPYFEELISDKELNDLWKLRKVWPQLKEHTSKLPRRAKFLALFLTWAYLQFNKTARKNFLTMSQTMLGKLTREFARTFSESFRTNIGVLSFSRSFDNLQMWAHYADSHAGFVIAFDENHAVFNEKASQDDDLRHLRQVAYSKNKPTLDLRNVNAIDVLLRKSIDWAYEEEARIIKALGGAIARGIKLDSMGRFADAEIHLFALPSSAIQGVILGARMNAANKERLLNLIRTDSRYAHVWIKEAALQQDKFALQFLPLPGQPTHPNDLRITITTEHLPAEAATELGNRIAALMKSVLTQHFDLSKLSRIYVAEELGPTAESVLGIKWQTDEAAQAIAIPTEAGLAVVGFIRLSDVRPLLDGDSSQSAIATHLLHRHLAHCHNVSVRFKVFGQWRLTERGPGARGLLSPVAMNIWNEYIVSRLSSPSVTQDIVSDCLSSLRNGALSHATNVRQAIFLYRRHGDINELTQTVLTALSELLSDAATVLGYVDGLEVTLLKQNLELAIASTEVRYRQKFNDLATVLRKMNHYYPEWQDEAIFDDLVEIVRDLAFNWGIGFSDEGDRAYVAVP